MSAIQLQDYIVPGIRGVIIKGTLLRKYDLPEDLCLLDQDILEVELPNGIYIDVGWFPQNDANGRFVIRTYRDSFRQLLRKPAYTKNPFEVARLIGDLVSEYATASPARAISVSCSNGVTLQFRPEREPA